MQPPAGSQVSRVPAQRTPPDQLAPPAAPPAPQQQPRRTRTVLTVVAGVLALLCVSGAVIGYVLYDRATAPDRSTPDVVVAGYIQAFLADRDDTRASELACQEGADINDLRLLRDDLVARERRFGTKISTSWEDFKIQQQGDRASVEVVLILSAFMDGISQSDRQGWRFETQRKDGWRVCTAKRS
ncbi:Rv0361 family membrane protein [Micromonospora sp. L31]|uniref:Rv0361 family membrane protein n=1 Tax=Micromonospora sp. L31 TaxID=3452213 RepID=UPI003F8955F9